MLEFYDKKEILLIVKNFIPISLAIILLIEKKHSFTRLDYLVLFSFFFLCLGLNFSFFCYTKTYYLFVITLIYFFEIQIQIFLVIKFLRNSTIADKKTHLKTYLIFSVSLIFIIVFFPFFDFPIQILFFIRIFQYVHYFTLIYKNQYINNRFILGLWLLIFSNVLLLVDMMFFEIKFEYQFIMLLFYSSKIFFLDAYLKSEPRFQSAKI